MLFKTYGSIHNTPVLMLSTHYFVDLIICPLLVFLAAR